MSARGKVKRTPLKRIKAINHKSSKKVATDGEKNRVTAELREIIGDRCENCRKYYRLPEPHHIEKQSHTLDHSKENRLLLCDICHIRANNPNSKMRINSVSYEPFTIEMQKEIVRRRSM